VSGFFTFLFDLIKRLFGSNRTPPGPALPPDSEDEPAQALTRRVLLIVYDPIVDAANNLKLSQKMNWSRADDLVNGYISDIAAASSGLVTYQVVERLERNEFPVKAGGFHFTPSSYMDIYNRISDAHVAEYVDYDIILQQFNILARVAAGELDEVWIFAFPFAGLYESTMGGAGAFRCNSPVLPNTSGCPRRFVIMGFSYERGVGEMLEAFGHRAEFILGRVFSKLTGAANLYRRFALYDLIAPGNAQVGTIHFAPNSNRDYDWSNPRFVASYCDDWYNFPNFKGLPKQVSGPEWGNGDTRAHHVWWLEHLPKVAGRRNGVAHNWWQYIADPNRVV
jgi:hypothetical protein